MQSASGLAAIEAMDKDFLIPKDIAPVLGCDPYAINVQAKADATALGFPVCVTGTRVRIPRLAFVHWMKYGVAPVILPEPTNVG